MPLAVEAVMRASGSELALRTMRAVSWVMALTALNAVALLLAWRTWALLSGAAADIDELIGSSQGREKVARWLARSLAPPRQMVCAVCVGLASAALLGLTQPAIESRLEIGPVSYLAVIWTGAILGDCLYWLIVISELGRRILRLRDLNLIWHSPASTPAVAKLSDMFGLMTISVLCLFILIAILNRRASAYGNSATLESLSTAFPVGAAVATLLAGLTPHVWLYLAVRDARRVTLKRLRGFTGLAPEKREQVEACKSGVELYRLVESSPGLPFSTTSMVEFTAAVLGTLLAFFLGG